MLLSTVLISLSPPKSQNSISDGPSSPDPFSQNWEKGSGDEGPLFQSKIRNSKSAMKSPVDFRVGLADSEFDGVYAVAG